MRKVFKFLPFWLSVLILVVGCTLQTNPVPTLPPFPTPNRTMTALFSTPLPSPALTRPAAATPTPTQLATAVTQPTATISPTNPVIQVTATEQATATSQPTQTSPPAPTATADLSHRAGTSTSAKLLATRPVIDGDWNDLPAKEYPAEIVVFGASNWKSRDDLSASFRIGWDAANLYLGVKVHDDVYAQNATGADLFKGDSLEILLDTNVPSDYYVHKDSPDDFQLGISPGKPDVMGTKEAYRWLPASIAGSRSGVVIASQRNQTEHVTRYEVAIPWSVFEVIPKSGQHFGFVLSVSDNDNISQNVQQKMVSNVKTRILTDPTTWGDLTLAP
jgi:hypothetical protein